MDKKNKTWRFIIITNKRQTDRPLVREGAQQRQGRKIQTELISGRKSQGGLDAILTDWLTDWLTDRQS
jgi:hypothetical protein